MDVMGTYTRKTIIWNPKAYEALEDIYKFHSRCHVAGFCSFQVILVERTLSAPIKNYPCGK